MWELELWERDGTHRRCLGLLGLREVQHDSVSGTVSVALEVGGGKSMAVVQVREVDLKLRPWKTALVALDKLYGGSVSTVGLKADGRCNGLSRARGRRCRLDALPGRFYCQVHDPLGARGDNESTMVR